MDDCNVASMTWESLEVWCPSDVCWCSKEGYCGHVDFGTFLGYIKEPTVIGDLVLFVGL